MSVFNNLKYLIKYGNTKEYKDYTKALSLNKEDANRFSEYIKKCANKIKDMNSNNISKDSDDFKAAYTELQRWQYELNQCFLLRPFIRPNNQFEIDERNRIADTFSKDLLNIVGENSNLRFHGTPIYYAKQIIESKKISSTSDRHDGYMRSTDLSGHCSASSIKSLDRTIQFFTDFASYNRSLPCGVLFVLNEKEGDSELRKYDEMLSVDFEKNPEQLVAILCSNEVKNMISKWCINSNIPAEKVFTFNSFLEYAKNNNMQENIASEYKQSL